MAPRNAGVLNGFVVTGQMTCSAVFAGITAVRARDFSLLFLVGGMGALVKQHQNSSGM
jgi:hypothetical protein